VSVQRNTILIGRIDDIHWIDRPSAAALAFVANRLT
jgi:hypothetical protein